MQTIADMEEPFRQSFPKAAPDDTKGALCRLTGEVAKFAIDFTICNAASPEILMPCTLTALLKMEIALLLARARTPKRSTARLAFLETSGEAAKLLSKQT